MSRNYYGTGRGVDHDPMSFDLGPCPTSARLEPYVSGIDSDVGWPRSIFVGNIVSKSTTKPAKPRPVTTATGVTVDSRLYVMTYSPESITETGVCGHWPLDHHKSWPGVAFRPLIASIALLTLFASQPSLSRWPCDPGVSRWPCVSRRSRYPRIPFGPRLTCRTRWTYGSLRPYGTCLTRRSCRTRNGRLSYCLPHIVFRQDDRRLPPTQPRDKSSSGDMNKTALAFNKTPTPV